MINQVPLNWWLDLWFGFGFEPLVEGKWETQATSSTRTIPAEGSSGTLQICTAPQRQRFDHADLRRGSRAQIKNRTKSSVFPKAWRRVLPLGSWEFSSSESLRRVINIMRLIAQRHSTESLHRVFAQSHCAESLHRHICTEPCTESLHRESLARRNARESHWQGATLGE